MATILPLAEMIASINSQISKIRSFLIIPTEANNNDGVILKDNNIAEISAPEITLTGDTITLNTQKCAYIDDKISVLETKITELATRITALESADNEEIK